MSLETRGETACAGQRSTYRILIAPDSYKGSVSAERACQAVAAGLRRAVPDAQLSLVPIADGGEGTAQTVASAAGGRWDSVEAVDANGNSLKVPYAICSPPDEKSFAIFDVASVVGLPDARVKPERRTTKGVGLVLRELAEKGHRNIVVGLGGSSTNDAGVGLLAECGTRFGGANGAPVPALLAHLPEIEEVQIPSDPWWRGLSIVGLSDVDNPLTGSTGATQVFGPQKGVQDLDNVDKKIGAFASLCGQAFECHDFHSSRGAGAAGGLGFAIKLLGGRLQSGADFILRISGAASRMSEFDWVITGEGKSDSQTLMGKGPGHIAKLARAHGVPVTLLSGAVANELALSLAFDGCFSIANGPLLLVDAMEMAPNLIESAAFELGRFLLAQRAATKFQKGKGELQ